MKIKSERTPRGTNSLKFILIAVSVRDHLVLHFVRNRFNLLYSSESVFFSHFYALGEISLTYFDNASVVSSVSNYEGD